MDLKNTGDDIPWSHSFDNRQNSQKPSNELKAIAQRHGCETLFEPHTTSNTNVFFSNKTIDANFNGLHNTDFHEDDDDHHHTFCYLCSINQHEHVQTKPRDESKRRKLIPYNNPKARLSSSLDRVKQDSSSSIDLIAYQFIVRTGTKKNSGTRAQVFLCLYGTEKNWTSIHLQARTNQNLSTSIDGFPSGSVRTFCLKGPNIGQLHHLNVNLVGSRSEKEWFLKEIEITNLNNSVTWLCEFNCWLPKTDEQQINEIKPNVYQQTKLSLSIYILQIRTGEKSFANTTNANIQIRIHGSESQTSQLKLIGNRANLFEPNQLDTFAIVGSDLGDLLQIMVESDKSQSPIDWDIKDMILWKIIPNDDHRQFHVYFPFNICLNKKVHKFKANKELYPLTDYHLKGPICYQVIVKTGSVTNAGTDANVFLIMYGKSGRSAIHQLDNRLKNDFERNSISEFTIMDIDIGTIDRIKIWHDNSNLGSAWFLDSILIRKKYSTCYTISNIYTQRLEHISKVLYHQFREHMKKNSTTRTPSKHEDEHLSMDRQSLKSNDSYSSESNDRLGSSRSILRGSSLYDRASLRKKVTWDEHSIGSQDDLLSIETQRIKQMQTIEKQQQKSNREDSFHDELNHIDHQIYWISSHNYMDKKWKIKSIEETNSFDFDSSIRSLLLSDRSILNNHMKASTDENNDEIYEFKANCWLKKDEEDSKPEVYLTPKLIQPLSNSSDININMKKKHHISSAHHIDDHHQKYDDETYIKESKHSSPHDLEPIERSSRNLNLHSIQLSSSHLLNTSQKQHSIQETLNPPSRPSTTLRKHDESLRINSSMDKLPQSSLLTQHSKPSRHMNDLTKPLTSEEELLARITANESSHRPRSSTTPLLPSSQHSKLPWNTNKLTIPITNDHTSSMTISNQLLNHPRSSATSWSSSHENIKSSHNNDHLPMPLVHAHHSLAKIPHEQQNDARLAPISMSSSSHNLKTSHVTHDPFISVGNERESLKRITNDSLNRSQSLLPLNPQTKLARNTNNPPNSLINKRETLLRTPIEPLISPRATVSPLTSYSRLSKSSQSSNESINSLAKPSIESTLRSKSTVRSNPDLSSRKSIYDQVYHSTYGTVPSDDF